MSQSSTMKRSDQYLGSSFLRATADTMAVASSVLAFDIVELWSRDEGKLKCTYVHGTEDLIKVYPDVILGHYPNHKREHKLSPHLCDLAKESPERYHWRVVTEQEEANFKGDILTRSPLHPDLVAPIKTQMAYLVEGETDGSDVFIVGFSLSKVPFSSSKLKFLSGLGYAIFVANQNFDLDESEDADSANALPPTSSTELDVKEFLPRPISTITSVAELAALAESESNYTGRVYSAKYSGQGGMDMLSAPIILGLAGDQRRPVNLHPTSMIATMAEESTATVDQKSHSSHSCGESVKSDLLAPVWEPVDAYSFPVIDLPILSRCRNDLALEDFKELMHIADGSNSNIYLGLLAGERCIVKMVKESVERDVVAMQEFDVEHAMLCRFEHPNIIRLLGAGRSPRRFIVLEWLGGGTLNSILQEHQVAPGFAKRLFRKPSFTYSTLLSRSRDMASALQYLHSCVHPEATVIHRDLKPDNIGFTKDGTLKLLDFGLCTVVKRRSSPTQAYEMTGNTGSLRYMAPEVALRKAYSEKADVYSFGVMLWQMARDQMPYKGMNRADFITKVALRGERPKADKSWPAGFTALLESCWHPEQSQRPSFDSIVRQIDVLSENIGGNMWKRMVRPSSGVPDKDRRGSTPQDSPVGGASRESSRAPTRQGSREGLGDLTGRPPPPPVQARRGKEDSRSSWF